MNKIHIITESNGETVAQFLCEYPSVDAITRTLQFMLPVLLVQGTVECRKLALPLNLNGASFEQGTKHENKNKERLEHYDRTGN
jgi:hypothetical protein